MVSGAVITSNGGLTPNFRYIDDLRAASSASHAPADFSGVDRKVRRECLVLGSLCFEALLR